MLRLLWTSLSLALLLFVAWPCAAQDSVDLRRDQGPRVAPAPDTSLSPVSATPEMWFYEQERSRYDNPKLAIRHRAEVRGQQRQDRLAALKWFGISNSRPTVSSTPMYGGYSVGWGSNTYGPLRWRTPNIPIVGSRPTNGLY